jgi:hypothetical protein
MEFDRLGLRVSPAFDKKRRLSTSGKRAQARFFIRRKAEK